MREEREKDRTVKSCEGKITKSECERVKKAAPEKKNKEILIWLVQAMGIDRMLVSGKEMCGLHLDMLQLHWNMGKIKARALKGKALGLVWMCAAEGKSKAKKPSQFKRLLQ